MIVSVNPCCIGQYTLSVPLYRGSFTKSWSPVTSAKFAGKTASPFGGGGLRRSKTRRMALPTMCPLNEQGCGPW